MALPIPIEIPLEGRTSAVPSLYDTKTPDWYFRNVQYCLTYYNRRVNYLGLAGIQDTASININTLNLPPVLQMIRMLQYYLGIQPNIDYAYVFDDVTRQTMQSMWVRNQTVKEFVDYFRGNMMTRLTNAQWTAKPLSERATAERTDAFNKFMFAYDMKPYLKLMQEQSGVAFGPAQKEFELPEHIKEYMDTTWRETGAELCGDIANGIWFKEQWLQKALESFMYVVTCSTCAMHHYVENGQSKQETVMPYELVFDSRTKDDFGRGDQFIGKVSVMTPYDCFTRYPELTNEQRKEIERIAQDSNLQANYNLAPNMSWWTASPYNRNMVTAVTMYWRGKNQTGKKPIEKESDKNPRIAKADPGDLSQYIYDDIYQCTIIGNKYIARFGPIDNVVESYDDKARPVLPIIRFRPNTFIGESISEVQRIHRIVDEMDYIDYKVRDMVGKAKGKVYWIDGNKFGDQGTGVKDFLENINAMGIHVGVPSGEDEADKQPFYVFDWTLDQNINKLWEYRQILDDRVKKILSTSDASMGQQRSYMGYNTTQSVIAQNSLGTTYLFDGTMEWIVLNMRYAANVQKNLYALNDNMEASIVVGDRGVVNLKLIKDLTWEQIFVKLNINDQMDAEQKKRITDIALAAAQNSQISLLDFLKIESAMSVTEAKNLIKHSLKEADIKNQKNMQAQQENQMQQLQAQQIGKVAQQQLSDDNANYRAEISALSKNINQLMQLMQNPPAPSPLGMQLAQQDAQQQQAMQQQMQQQQMQQGAPQGQPQEQPQEQPMQ
jgi:hypothetical protein